LTSSPDGGGCGQYDAFYRGTGFTYDVETELAFIAGVLIPAADWATGDRVIELGAGQGLHAALLQLAGMDVTAVEASQAGVDAARATYPGLDIDCADAATWTTSRPGHVYARGLSWYHYELNGINQRGVDVPACTRRVMDDLVAPGCVFAMQIYSDLTGHHPDTEPDLTGDGPPDARVHQSTLEEFTALFSPHGHVTVTDWSGDPITPGCRHDRGVLVITQKPPG
jgi:SAM-dependent methyltransferase